MGTDDRGEREEEPIVGGEGSGQRARPRRPSADPGAESDLEAVLGRLPGPDDRQGEIGDPPADPSGGAGRQPRSPRQRPAFLTGPFWLGLLAKVPGLLAKLGPIIKVVIGGLQSRRTPSRSGRPARAARADLSHEGAESAAPARGAGRPSGVTSREIGERGKFSLRRHGPLIAAGLVGLIVVGFLFRLLGGLMSGGDKLQPQLTPVPTMVATSVSGGSAPAATNGYYGKPGAPSQTTFDLVLLVADGPQHTAQLRATGQPTVTLTVDPNTAYVIMRTAEGITGQFAEGQPITPTNGIGGAMLATNYEGQRRLSLDRTNGIEIRLAPEEQVGVVVLHPGTNEAYIVISNVRSPATGSKNVKFTIQRAGVTEPWEVDPARDAIYIRTLSERPADTVTIGTRFEGETLVVYLPGVNELPQPTIPTPAPSPTAGTGPKG